MYKQYLEIKNCKTGKGTFSTVRIPSNAMILEITGPIVLDRDIIENPSMYLQVGPNTFLGPTGDVDDYINHSCDPNCRMHIVGNRAFLYSIYVIPVGGELTFDYATTSTDTLDTWQMQCGCGSNKCRKTISGCQYLDHIIYENYKNKGMLPLYILQPNMIQKR